MLVYKVAHKEVMIFLCVYYSRTRKKKKTYCWFIFHFYLLSNRQIVNFRFLFAILQLVYLSTLTVRTERIFTGVTATFLVHVFCHRCVVSVVRFNNDIGIFHSHVSRVWRVIVFISPKHGTHVYGRVSSSRRSVLIYFISNPASTVFFGIVHRVRWSSIIPAFRRRQNYAARVCEFNILRGIKYTASIIYIIIYV